jgi:ankyrin repeat protein
MTDPADRPDRTTRTDGTARPIVDLFEAIRANDLTSLDRFVRAGADLDARDARNRTPLMLAAREGSGEAVRMLLAAGADPHARSVPDMMTPLMYAARRTRTRRRAVRY